MTVTRLSSFNRARVQPYRVIRRSGNWQQFVQLIGDDVWIDIFRLYRVYQDFMRDLSLPSYVQ